MNLLDFVVLALILLLAIRGYFRGFFRELFGLAAWIGGGLAAYLLGPEYGPAVSARWSLPIAIGEALAALGIFVAVYLGCQIAGYCLYRIARAFFLGPVDRAGGLVLGAAKAVAMAAIFCMVVTSRRGLPQFSERINESPLLSVLVAEGWNAFAVARESTGIHPVWQHPYSKRELEAREELERFLTPKPTATAPPERSRAAPTRVSHGSFRWNDPPSPADHPSKPSAGEPR